MPASILNFRRVAKVRSLKLPLVEEELVLAEIAEYAEKLRSQKKYKSATQRKMRKGLSVGIIKKLTQ
jgi:hypothetical protein